MKKTSLLFAFVCLSLLSAAQTGLTNLSFETWTTIAGPTPSGYVSLGATQITGGAQHLNSYVRLTSNGQATTSPSAAGAMQLATLVGTVPVSGAPYTQKPIALTGYYKCNIVGTDTVFGRVDMTKNFQSLLNSPATAGFKATVTTTVWTSFSIALTYTGTFNPDSAKLYFAANKAYAGRAAGSSGTTLDLDNLSFIMGGTGLKQIENENILLSAFPNPANDKIYLESNSMLAEEVIIYNGLGLYIESKKFEGKRADIDLGNYSPGLYYYSVLDKNGMKLKTDKFVVIK